MQEKYIYTFFLYLLPLFTFYPSLLVTPYGIERDFYFISNQPVVLIILIL